MKPAAAGDERPHRPRFARDRRATANRFSRTGSRTTTSPQSRWASRNNGAKRRNSVPQVVLWIIAVKFL